MNRDKPENKSCKYILWENRLSFTVKGVMAIPSELLDFQVPNFLAVQDPV